MSERCPKCGAEAQVGPCWGPAYVCGTYTDTSQDGFQLAESEQCLRRQLEQVTAERDGLRAIVETAQAAREAKSS